MKGVLLAGGTGSRLRPITHTGPKQLIPVANKPVIEYAIEDFVEAGIREIGVVIGNEGREDIQRSLGDGSEYGVEITYIVQGNPIGLAHAVGCAADFVGEEDFVVYLGDNMLNRGITDLVENFERADCAAGIALQEIDNPQQFGVADLDKNGSVNRLVEKPDNPPSNFALIGIYVFSSEIFDVVSDLEPSWRGELEITDAIQGLIDRGHPVGSHVVDGWWKDTGKPEDILEANRLVLDERDCSIKGRVEDGADVTGNVDMQSGAVVKSGAVVRGPASIATDALIESDTYVGPYTSIGPSSTIAHVQIENSVVIGAADVRASAKIVGSLIGQGTTIGDTDELLPDGQRFVVGENSHLKL